MYKTESTLGLIGSILGIIAVVLILIIGLLVGFVFNAFDAALEEAGWEVVDNGINAVAGFAIGWVVIGLVLALASVILGFIGTGKLRSDDKNGGVFLIIAGALALISLFTGGWYGIATTVLFLVGGIMALTKKAPAANA